MAQVRSLKLLRRLQSVENHEWLKVLVSVMVLVIVVVAGFPPKLDVCDPIDEDIAEIIKTDQNMEVRELGGKTINSTNATKKMINKL
jgi:hypothetical protein